LRSGRNGIQSAAGAPAGEPEEKAMRTRILIVLTLATLLPAGCAGPEIAFTARTRIEPDGRTHRSVRID